MTLNKHEDGGKEPLAIDHQRKAFAGFKRVAEQTGILTKEPDHPPQECSSPAHHPYSATPSGWR